MSLGCRASWFLAGTATDLREARERLSEAVDAFDWRTHGRAHALCTSQLALVYVGEGEVEQAVRWGRQAVRCAAGIRSTRVDGSVLAIGAAAARSSDPRMRELVDEIAAAAGAAK